MSMYWLCRLVQNTAHKSRAVQSNIGHIHLTHMGNIVPLLHPPLGPQRLDLSIQKLLRNTRDTREAGQQSIYHNDLFSIGSSSHLLLTLYLHLHCLTQQTPATPPPPPQQTHKSKSHHPSNRRCILTLSPRSTYISCVVVS